MKKLGFSKKNVIMLCLTLVICGAVYLNWRFNSDGTYNITDALKKPDENKILGQAQFVDGEGDGDDSVKVNVTDTPMVTTGDAYFTEARLNRQMTRDESLELLRSVAENEAAAADAREKAQVDITALASAMAMESNIEALVKSKGFEECLAIVSGENVNVVVKSDGLLMNEAAQIKDIVVAETGTAVKNIKIVEMN